MGQLVAPDRDDVIAAVAIDALRYGLGGLFVMFLLPAVGGPALGFLASVLAFALLFALVGVIRVDH